MKRTDRNLTRDHTENGGGTRRPKEKGRGRDTRKVVRQIGGREK